MTDGTTFRLTMVTPPEVLVVVEDIVCLPLFNVEFM